MCPEAQDLESCPQMHETITASQKKSGNIYGSERSAIVIQGSFPFGIKKKQDN